MNLKFLVESHEVFEVVETQLNALLHHFQTKIKHLRNQVQINARYMLDEHPGILHCFEEIQHLLKGKKSKKKCDSILFDELCFHLGDVIRDKSVISLSQRSDWEKIKTELQNRFASYIVKTSSSVDPFYHNLWRL